MKKPLDVCIRLAEAKELPQEMPVDLLMGLTLCLVDEFKTLFEHKLQVAKVESLGIIICPSLRSWEKYVSCWHLQLNTTTVST
jgi:hypothetical protein